MLSMVPIQGFQELTQRGSLLHELFHHASNQCDRGLLATFLVSTIGEGDSNVTVIGKRHPELVNNNRSEYGLTSARNTRAPQGPLFAAQPSLEF